MWLSSSWNLLAASLPELVAKAKPAVVEIVAMDEKGTPTSLGTGFFVSSDGLVVTNFHVIKGATSLSAISSSGAIFFFERVVAQPTGVDLAILQFRAKDVPFLHFGNSATAVQGQKIIVIGNPTGLTGSVSDGIISAFREDRKMIQITAPISPGSSGSPVMDEDGRVIGVATLQSVEGQNLNFAIAVENLAGLVNQSPEQLSRSTTEMAVPTATHVPTIEAQFHFYRGMLLLSWKDRDGAIAAFIEAIRIEPYYKEAFLNRGVAYLHKFQDKEAIADYTEAIRIEPRYAEAYLSRGDLYFEDSNYVKAIADYTEAIRVDANFASAYLGRGNAYAESGSFEKAISDYNESINLNPSAPNPYADRGLAYYKHGDYGAAINDYNKAIGLEPHAMMFHLWRGDAYCNYGDPKTAIADYTEAIRIEPDFSMPYQQRGTAFLRTGDSVKADADFATAKRLRAGQ